MDGPRAARSSRTARWHGSLAVAVVLLGFTTTAAASGTASPRSRPHPQPARVATPFATSPAGGLPTGCRRHTLIRVDAREVLALADRRLRRDAATLPAAAYPSITDTSGRWLTTDATGWTSGFFPGSLWLAYQHTGRSVFRAAARRWTRLLAPQAADRSTHDVGFQILTSFGNGLRLTHEPGYRGVILQAARSLSSRYSAIVRAVRSWGRRGDQRHFKVIVDGMMNIDLLFAAHALGGSPTFERRAVRHATTTLRHFVRRDGSVRHLVDFDPATGAVVSVGNPQGYRPGSTWSRGQAWALDGFATAYAATGRRAFLVAAERTAAYYLRHVPGDCVPYWDFDAPGIPQAPRDSSAAAIAADGLAQLSRLAPGPRERAHFRRAATSVLGSLVHRYVASSGQALLTGATATYGVDPSGIGTSYGDYYLMRALLRWLHT